MPPPNHPPTANVAEKKDRPLSDAGEHPGSMAPEARQDHDRQIRVDVEVQINTERPERVDEELEQTMTQSQESSDFEENPQSELDLGKVNEGVMPHTAQSNRRTDEVEVAPEDALDSQASSSFDSDPSDTGIFKLTEHLVSTTSKSKPTQPSLIPKPKQLPLRQPLQDAQDLAQQPLRAPQPSSKSAASRRQVAKKPTKEPSARKPWNYGGDKNDKTRLQKTPKNLPRSNVPARTDSGLRNRGFKPIESEHDTGDQSWVQGMLRRKQRDGDGESEGLPCAGKDNSKQDEENIPNEYYGNTGANSEKQHQEVNDQTEDDPRNSKHNEMECIVEYEDLEKREHSETTPDNDPKEKYSTNQEQGRSKIPLDPTPWTLSRNNLQDLEQSTSAPPKSEMCDSWIEEHTDDDYEEKGKLTESDVSEKSYSDGPSLDELGSRQLGSSGIGFEGHGRSTAAHSMYTDSEGEHARKAEEIDDEDISESNRLNENPRDDNVVRNETRNSLFNSGIYQLESGHRALHDDIRILLEDADNKDSDVLEQSLIRLLYLRAEKRAQGENGQQPISSVERFATRETDARKSYLNKNHPVSATRPPPLNPEYQPSPPRTPNTPNSRQSFHAPLPPHLNGSGSRRPSQMSAERPTSNLANYAASTQSFLKKKLGLIERRSSMLSRGEKEGDRKKTLPLHPDTGIGITRARTVHGLGSSRETGPRDLPDVDPVSPQTIEMEGFGSSSNRGFLSLKRYPDASGLIEVRANGEPLEGDEQVWLKAIADYEHALGKLSSVDANNVQIMLEAFWNQFEEERREWKEFQDTYDESRNTTETRIMVLEEKVSQETDARKRAEGELSEVKRNAEASEAAMAAVVTSVEEANEKKDNLNRQLEEDLAKERALKLEDHRKWLPLYEIESKKHGKLKTAYESLRTEAKKLYEGWPEMQRENRLLKESLTQCHDHGMSMKEQVETWQEKAGQWEAEYRTKEDMCEQLRSTHQQDFDSKIAELAQTIKQYHAHMPQNDPDWWKIEGLRKKIEKQEKQLNDISEMFDTMKSDKVIAYQRIEKMMDEAKDLKEENERLRLGLPPSPPSSNDGDPYQTGRAECNKKPKYIPWYKSPEEKEKRKQFMDEFREKQRQAREEQDRAKDMIEQVRAWRMGLHYPPLKDGWSERVKQRNWKRWEGERWLKEAATQEEIMEVERLKKARLLKCEEIHLPPYYI